MYPHVILNLYDYLFWGAQTKMHLRTKIVESYSDWNYMKNAITDFFYFWMNHPFQLVPNKQ